MGKNANERIEKYTQKLDPDITKSRLEVQQTTMVRHFSNKTGLFYDIEVETKQVLDGQNVPTIFYPFYLAFARELLKKRLAGFSGASMAAETQVLLSKWTGRTLVQSVLEAIRDDVFDISAPAGP